MSNFDETFERIKLATHTRTQIELAKVLDIRQSSISDAKRRNSIPSDWCIKLFERFGLNPDWIKRGAGPMYLRTEKGYATAEGMQPEAAREEAAPYADAGVRSDVAPVYSMQSWPFGEEGDGAPKVVGKLPIPAFLAGSGVKVFELDSTSMEPLIRKGAYIGVDSLQTKAVSGELYAVGLPYEGLAIKRVFLNSATGEAVLRTENPQHPEMVLPMTKLGEAIIGRVVWTLNKY